MRPDPKAVAALIKPHWDTLSPLSAEDVHAAHYLMAICEALGVTPDPINIPHLVALMKEKNIPMYRGDDYPKILTAPDKYGRDVQVLYPFGHPRYGQPVVFESAERKRAMSLWSPPHEEGNTAQRKVAVRPARPRLFESRRSKDELNLR